ncbi:type VII secretion protein EccC [Mycobacterium sp. 1100029.7]|nr:type VII secretion protein EccC [Mycobacterium sp. 1100029.7]
MTAPPELSPSESPSPLMRLLPIGMSVAAVGVIVVTYSSGASVGRNPAFLVFPMMMLVSMVLAVVARRGRRPGGGIVADRVEYLAYLNRLRHKVSEIAAAQRNSLNLSHPDPGTLWTLIGGPRMWERRVNDPDFCQVRVGVGTRPLWARLIAPEFPPDESADPVTVAAAQRFLQTYASICDVPLTVDLTATASVTVDGDLNQARGLLRAMICGLAVLHPPDQLRIVGVTEAPARDHWDWLKWLPHNQHPVVSDEAGPARMVYSSMAAAHRVLTELSPPARVVVIRELDRRNDDETRCAITGWTIVDVGPDRAGSPLSITHSGVTQPLTHPDRLDLLDAVICARRLAAHRMDAASGDRRRSGLGEFGDSAGFDPSDRLRASIGYTLDGAPVQLDIKEPAENGMGPHGLCVGATGSGKSELLRTVALGMMARNPPDVLNLLLIDFKGGATFLEFAQAPHVAAVVTNLAEEAPLVARMRDALAGEMNRRQRLLRDAGCPSVAAYQHGRRDQTTNALPTLFIIVDEFSELLSQHPDFADTFVAIGRLGRSLGMHLLLASQRLEEGRLRGLEAHLSYRVCMKTLSASESRIVLGTADAYELPATPGAGLLRSGSGELVRFQTTSVSECLPVFRQQAAHPEPPASARLFGTEAAGPLTEAPVHASSAPTILRAVLQRLGGHGPPAHQVWLPPLAAAPPLKTLLRETVSGALQVPIGIVDRPLEQSRTPLLVTLSASAGHVAVVGAPQSGKSTVLRTLVTALAATHDSARVQFYCLDFGGATLAALRPLPHVGDVAGRAQPQLVVRMVAELQSIVRSRETSSGDDGTDGHDRFGDVFLVIDGWANVRHEFPELEEAITALAAQGLSYGVHVVLSASRWAEIRPSLKDQIGTRIELRLGDPADSEIDRKRAHEVPRDRPGRGLSQDGLHMIIAQPQDVDPAPPCHHGLAAPPIPLLPTRVDHDAVVAKAGRDRSADLLLGIEERRLAPLAVDFDKHSHLLILGDNECGKTATLRTVCREITRTKTPKEAHIVVVDYRRTLLGVVEPQHLGGYAMSPAALRALMPGLLGELQRRMPAPDVGMAQLRARSWWSGPDVYLVVDDYDLVATPAGNPMLSLLEYLPHAKDVGVHVIVARRSAGAARAQFEPLLASLLEIGCLGLMMSARPDDGILLGSVRPTRLPPGRGVVVTHTGDEQVIQVGWSPAP